MKAVGKTRQECGGAWLYTCKDQKQFTGKTSRQTNKKIPAAQRGAVTAQDHRAERPSWCHRPCARLIRSPCHPFPETRSPAKVGVMPHCVCGVQVALPAPRWEN